MTSLNNDAETALAMGYLTGQKSALAKDFSEALRVVGLSHIVVASGYNLAVLIGAAKKRLGKISRKITLLGASTLIFAFIAVTGVNASMLRAGLVALLSLFAWYFGRSFRPGRILLYVAAMSLIYDPRYITDLGWMLSFAAFAGVIILAPIVTRFAYGTQKPAFFPALVIETLSAQAMCLPIGIYYFGNISGISLLANLMVTPSIGLAMFLTFILGVAALAPSFWSVLMPAFEPILKCLAWPLKTLLKFHLASVRYLSQIPWASMEVAKHNLAVLVALFSLITVFAIILWWFGQKDHSISGRI